jgi:predicted DNA-binding transcriptional regulator YafY
MNQLDRLYQLERLLLSRQSLGRNALLDELEISRATLKRYLEVLRDRMNVPVVYDRYSNTYAISQPADKSKPGTQRQELPGVWFSQQEIVALLTMYQLIAGLDSAGMLQRHLQPILQRLNTMLASTHMQAQELQRRVRIIGAARREVPSQFFELVGLALTQRRRLRITYFTRSRNETSERTLSPQRLVHHRNTWYLDAWCHARKALLRFALDAIREALVLDEPAKELALATVEKTLDEGYGIYHGEKLQWATLVFTPQSAIWVAPEQWHPDQKSRKLPDGSLELKVPYTYDSELLMDIQRHGADVRVVSPVELRDKLLAGLRRAVDQYGDRAKPKVVRR